MEATKEGLHEFEPPEINVNYGETPPGWRCFTLNSPIPKVKTYKYLEVDVLNNYSAKAYINIGFCLQEHFRHNDLPEAAETTFYMYGNSGEMYLNGKRFGETKFNLSSFGSTAGLLMYRNPKKDSDMISIIPYSDGIQTPKMTKLEIQEDKDAPARLEREKSELEFLEKFEEGMRKGKVDHSGKKRYDDIMEER